tara:strand:+ start:914 stop:1360 length:447 start_codon:yes stop_codon:yes gene_type:complete
MDISQYIQKIPEEVVRENIIPYTYNTQSRELLDDIISFIYTKEILIELYSETWHEWEDETYMDWLSNDISRFFNEDKATMLGFVDSNINKFKRLFKIFYKNYDKIKIINVMKKFESPSTLSLFHFNTCLGILTTSERLDFLKFITNIL